MAVKQQLSTLVFWASTLHNVSVAHHGHISVNIYTLHDAWLLILCKQPDFEGQITTQKVYAPCMLLAWCTKHQTHIRHLRRTADTASSPRAQTCSFLLAEALLLTEMTWGCRFCAAGKRNATPLATRHRHASSSTALA